MPIRPLSHGSIDSDIASILNGSTNDPKAIRYEAILHTKDDEIPITELVSIEVSRDYANNVCDYLLVTFTMVAGIYIRKINRNMDNLEMTIITHWYGKKYIDRYKFVVSKGPSNIAGTIYSGYTEEELNKLDKFVIEGQCLDRLVEVMRLTQVDGVYGNTKVSDVIKTVLSNVVNNIKIEDTATKTNINIVQPNNDKLYRHISIPLTAKITALNLPSYLQNTDYGVYSTDIGTYVQRYGYFEDNKEPVTTIFVYPLYNPELIDKPGRKLMIFGTPITTLNTVESSYILDGDIIKIIGSGDMRSNELSQSRLIDRGAGIIHGKPSNIMSDGAISDDNSVTVDKKANLSGKRLIKKTDGFDPGVYTGAHDNVYKQYSEVSKNMLSPYQITWNHSNPELLHPGMSVTYVYDDAEKGVIRLNGILHSCYNKHLVSSGVTVTLLNVLLVPYIEGETKKTNKVDVSYK